jgi:hypothetical protein
MKLVHMIVVGYLSRICVCMCVISLSEKTRPDIRLPTDTAQYNVSLSRNTVKPHNSQPPYLFVKLHTTPDVFQTYHSPSSPCEVTSIMLKEYFLPGQQACMPENSKFMIKAA